MQKFHSELFLPQLSVDCVIFGYKNKQLKVLISTVQFKTKIHSLPGGFIFSDECIDTAAKRILEERTGISDLFLAQFNTYGNPERKNHDLIANLEELRQQLSLNVQTDDLLWLTKRFISISYYALVDIDKVKLKPGIIDSELTWYNIAEVPKLIIDHNKMIADGLERLRDDFDKKLNGYALLPDQFTMKELQELYEVVYDRPYARNNFQKKILDLEILERLDKKYTGAANKAPYLYRFKENN